MSDITAVMISKTHFGQNGIIKINYETEPLYKPITAMKRRILNDRDISQLPKLERLIL